MTSPTFDGTDDDVFVIVNDGGTVPTFTMASAVETVTPASFALAMLVY